MTKPNTVKWRKVFLLSAVFLSFLLLQTACKKENKLFGENAIDQDEVLTAGTTDTFDIITYSIDEDSIISSNTVYNVLGKYNDPEFGTFDASFYTQLRLSGVNPDFGDPNALAVDSFVLAMQYAGSYGNPQNFNVEVFQMSDPLYTDSVYYTSTNKALTGSNLVDPAFGPVTPDVDGITVLGGTDTVAAQMRIPLDTNLARNMITEAMSGSGTFASNASFQEYFKGIHVRISNPMPAPGSGGVVYFDNVSAFSKVTIYYTTGGEQKKFDLLITSACSYFNHVEIDNSGTAAGAVLNDSTLGMTEYYAQSFNARAVIRIPGLSDIPSKAIVHSAKLVLPVSYQLGADYPPSTDLTVLTKEFETDDFYYTSGIEATYDVYQKAYVLDLRDHIQRITYDVLENTGLYITPRYFINSAERIIFNGTNTTNKDKPRLIIKYTEF